MSDIMTETQYVIKKTIAAGNVVLYWNGRGLWVDNIAVAARYSEHSDMLHRDLAALKKMVGKANVEIETIRPPAWVTSE